MKIEKGLIAAFPQGNLTGRPDLTGAAVTMPTKNGSIGRNSIDWNKHCSFVLHGGGKEVLRITPEGELIIHDATEAAKALLFAWQRVRGN